MKRIILLTSMLMGVFNLSAQVRFEKLNFSEALLKAKKEKKLLFIDAYAVWCGPCKEMDRTTFLDPTVGQVMSKDFVAVKIDVERGEGPSIKARYAIEGLPSFLFLDGNGHPVYRSVGYQKAETFIGVLNMAKKNSTTASNLSVFEIQYQKEKGSLSFLKDYLKVLRATESSGYYEVVEQYLSLQNEMMPSSREMVDFLRDHGTSLTFGGYADKIYEQNMGTVAWDKYVRKDVRQLFLNFPKMMAHQTGEYAIQKRDTSLLALAMRRSFSYGLPAPVGQKERLLTYYYQQTKQGELYKGLVRLKVDSISNSLNIKKLHADQASVETKLAKNPNQRVRSNALIQSERLRQMVLDYIQFANSTSDQKLVLKWSQKVYDVLPSDINNKVFYAKVQYNFGDKVIAKSLMEEIVSKDKNSKNIEGWKMDLAAMNNGGQVLF